MAIQNNSSVLLKWVAGILATIASALIVTSTLNISSNVTAATTQLAVLTNTVESLNSKIGQLSADKYTVVQALADKEVYEHKLARMMDKNSYIEIQIADIKTQLSELKNVK